MTCSNAFMKTGRIFPQEPDARGRRLGIRICLIIVPTVQSMDKRSTIWTFVVVSLGGRHSYSHTVIKAQIGKRHSTLTNGDGPGNAASLPWKDNIPQGGPRDC